MRAAYLLVLAAGVATAQQQSIGSIGQKSGNCSINFAGIQGGVTVTIQKIECPGVGHEALRFLTKQLNDRLKHEELERSDLKKQVEEWKNRFLELSERLVRRGVSNESSRRVEQLLKRGQFERAGKVLDEAIVDEEADVDRAAADHYERAQVYLCSSRRSARWKSSSWPFGTDPGI